MKYKTRFLALRAAIKAHFLSQTKKILFESFFYEYIIVVPIFLSKIRVFPEPSLGWRTDLISSRFIHQKSRNDSYLNFKFKLTF